MRYNFIIRKVYRGSGMYDFGCVLKKLRRERGLTQKQLGSRLNLSEATISKYESNTAAPSFETMRAIAAVLDVSLDLLYGNEPAATLSLRGLSEEQSAIMQDLAALFRSQNGAAQKRLSDEQYRILGRITVNFIAK